MTRPTGAVLTVLLCGLLAAVTVVVMQLLGAGRNSSYLGAGLGAALGAAIDLYRSTPGSRARQEANRRRHRESSPLWQPTENDKR